MIAIAKDNLSYPEYPYVNWIKGKSYECVDDGKMTNILDEKNIPFHFTGRARTRLDEIFYFKN